jgi:hypothetical protein
LQLESIVAVHSLKGGKGVDESGVGREAAKAGRFSIHLQLSCAGGEGKGGDRAAKRQCNGGRTVQYSCGLWLTGAPTRVPLCSERGFRRAPYRGQWASCLSPALSIRLLGLATHMGRSQRLANYGVVQLS